MFDEITVGYMVLILDGITQNMLRKFEGKQVFSGENKIRFVTVLVLNKCLYQVSIAKSLRRCAPISKLPSDIISMVWIWLMIPK